MTEYEKLKQRLASGWNTWNTRSVLSHVLLPEGFALNLGVKEYHRGQHKREFLIGQRNPADEQVRPGPRTYDGRYTALDVRWQGIAFDVESATEGDDLVLLVTPRESPFRRPPLLMVEGGILWNRPGFVERRGPTLHAEANGREIDVWTTVSPVEDPYSWSISPYLALPLAGPIGLSAGRARSLEEIRAIVARGKTERAAASTRFGELAEVYDAVQTCMAWDTVYDPLKERVISPVSRIWSAWAWGGYVLFCWDTYFAAALAAIDNRDLAFANAIEITREKTPSGFVPNFGAPNDNTSFDRSQPPVGAMMVLQIYRRHPERWFLEEVFADLLEWNRWWPANRGVDGYLAWGSSPYPPGIVNERDQTTDVNQRFGAALESGLDNSPMYDDVPFDPSRHVLLLADAGLMGLYLGDCRALAEIAEILGRGEEAAEVRARAERYAGKLQELWDGERGLYYNRHIDTGEFSRRISPTNFYPMLGRVPSPAQAERMVEEHLFNEREFWGEWVLPSISRDDPAYPDNHYWRGRIWAPMNFLVYLGLREYDLPEARRALAEKSKALLLKEWREKGHVHENYSAETGDGDDAAHSDAFYHWGALLGLIALMEEGHW
jgi:hypothetical protein